MRFLLPTRTPNLCQMLAWQHIPQPLQQTSNMGSFRSSPRLWQEWACVCQNWLLAEIADQIVKSPPKLWDSFHSYLLKNVTPFYSWVNFSDMHILQADSDTTRKSNCGWFFLPTIFFTHDNEYHAQYLKSWPRISLLALLPYFHLQLGEGKTSWGKHAPASLK